MQGQAFAGRREMWRQAEIGDAEIEPQLLRQFEGAFVFRCHRQRFPDKA